VRRYALAYFWGCFSGACLSLGLALLLRRLTRASASSTRIGTSSWHSATLPEQKQRSATLAMSNVRLGSTHPGTVMWWVDGSGSPMM